MGKEKDFRKCLIKIVYAPKSDDDKVELLRILSKKGPYCDEMKKLFKK